MKKFWIITVSVILVLAAALLVCSLVFREKKIPADDPGSQYAYFYAQNKKGLRITVNGPFPDGSVWTAESSNPAALSVAEKTQNEKEAAFRLNAGSAGSAAVSLRLSDSMDAPLYVLSLQVFVGSDGTVSVFDESHILPEQPVGGAGDAFTYRVSAEAAEVAVTVSGTGEEAWLPLVSGDRITALLSDPENGKCTLRISGGPAASGLVRLCSDVLGQCIALEVSYDVNGAASLVSHAVQPWDPEKTLQEDPEEYRMAFGLPRLPEDASLLGSGVKLWSAKEERDTFLCGWVRFSLNGKEWMLYTARERDVNDFLSVLCRSASVEQEVNYYGLDVSVFTADGGAVSAWAKDGRTWCLHGESATAEQQLEAMKTVMRATIYG